ncbi:LysM peptidoglycan-binding domain-containing protein [Acidaminococcus intestini]
MKKSTIFVALLAIGLITLGAKYERQPKPQPSQYLTFDAVVYTGDTLWSVCEKYAPYEDIQTIIQRAREENGIKDPGAIQPGTKIKIRVKK